MAPEGTQIVFVTGCSDEGIGAALAVAFHTQGCIVYASSQALTSMAGLPAGIHKLRVDVRDHATIHAAVQQILQEQGRIDILVNNAGVGLAGPLADQDLEAAKKVFDVNVWGLLAVTQAVVPHMAERRSGKIINVGSILGALAHPLTGIYCASKFAVRSLTDALRIELKPFNIQVMLVVPGVIESRIWGKEAAMLDVMKFKVHAQQADSIKATLDAIYQGRKTPAAKLADSVVKAALRRRIARQHWSGRLAGTIRLTLLLPCRLVDRILAKQFGFHKPVQPLALSPGKALAS